MSKSSKKAKDLAWIDEAIRAFTPNKLDDEEMDLRAQYQENARFLTHIKTLVKSGELKPSEAKELHKVFSHAHKEADNDPILALEVAYLGIMDHHGQMQRRS